MAHAVEVLPSKAVLQLEYSKFAVKDLIKAHKIKKKSFKCFFETFDTYFLQNYFPKQNCSDDIKSSEKLSDLPLKITPLRIPLLVFRETEKKFFGCSKKDLFFSIGVLKKLGRITLLFFREIARGGVFSVKGSDV